MSADFEQAWQGKLERSLSKRALNALKEQALAGGNHLSDASPRQEVISWTDRALSMLEQSLPSACVKDILTDCACHYPQEYLLSLHEIYAETRDIKQVHAFLQETFRRFLRELSLDEGEIAGIIDNGWGLAGTLTADKIRATKIPKSGNLKQYLRERDPQRKREMYCHCPRVRSAIALKATLPKSYCYCGAGFYKDIWETILGEVVHVEVLESVLQGDDVCTIAIRLPAGVEKI